MDATCNIQNSIHVFHLVHNMCPEFWVHIKMTGGLICLYSSKISSNHVSFHLQPQNGVLSNLRLAS